MDSNITISVKNLSKTFRIPHEGEFFGIIGLCQAKTLSDGWRNGSGKSTLLKILADPYLYKTDHR